MRQLTVLILGSYDGQSAVHQATRSAIHHAAGMADMVVNTRWMGPDDVLLYPGLVAEAQAVLLAPPAERPYRRVPTALLAALKTVREQDLPFLATGESHGLVYLELAQNVLGMSEAGGADLDPEDGDRVLHQLFLSEGASPRRLKVREVELEVVPGGPVAELYGASTRVTEKTDAVNGLNPDYAAALEEAGLRAGLLRREDQRPFLHALESRRYHVTAAFLPQLRSNRDEPHPLLAGLLTAGTDAA